MAREDLKHAREGIMLVLEGIDMVQERVRDAGHEDEKTYETLGYLRKAMPLIGECYENHVEDQKRRLTNSNEAKNYQKKVNKKARGREEALRAALQRCEQQCFLQENMIVKLRETVAALRVELKEVTRH